MTQSIGTSPNPAAAATSASLDSGALSPAGAATAYQINDTAAVDPEDRIRRQCDEIGIGWIEQDDIELQSDAASVLSAEDAIRLRAAPVRIDNDRLIVVMRNPLDLAAVDEISVLAGKPVVRHGMSADPFKKLIEQQYGTTAARMAERLAGEADESDLEHNIEAIEAEDLHRMAEQPTLINLVNLILLEAIRGRASDVHIEPFETQLKIKYRIDGVLNEQSPPPKHLQPAIISRIKIMAGMNIAERFVPQDGHISLRVEGRKIDLRVSTVPTIYGESVVLRILDKGSLPLELKELGMQPDHIAIMDRMLQSPHGMALVSGPTGSGKTTTLYAALQKLYTPEKKIITIEDPVEYELAGVNQIPVNPKRGLTFATGLRSILRQDPDVIMVGEIRDGETAEIAVRSALTGHLVFSTIHTNDALSSITRLVDMGVEPFLVSSVLEGVLAQRLGRRICSACRTTGPINDAITHRLSPAELELFAGKSYRGAGCDRCNNTGYRGRLGYFEVVDINPKMRQVISEGRSSRDLLTVVGRDYVSMRADGIRKAARGDTTIEEVLRATQDVEEG